MGFQCCSSWQSTRAVYKQSMCATALGFLEAQTLPKYFSDILLNI